jgi:hypothetical protein
VGRPHQRQPRRGLPYSSGRRAGTLVPDRILDDPAHQDGSPHRSQAGWPDRGGHQRRSPGRLAPR